MLLKALNANNRPKRNKHRNTSRLKALQALSEDDIKRLTGEEIKRHVSMDTRSPRESANAEIANRIVNSYKEKIAAGKDKYEDFEAVTNNVDMRYYPNVVQLLAEYVDNAHDVIYRLS